MVLCLGGSQAAHRPVKRVNSTSTSYLFSDQVRRLSKGQSAIHQCRSTSSLLHLLFYFFSLRARETDVSIFCVLGNLPCTDRMVLTCMWLTLEEESVGHSGYSGYLGSWVA